MFGLGFTEILILILIAFLVFGPERFPAVAKNFIKLLNELRRAFTEVKSEFYDVQTEAEKQFQQITNFTDKDAMSIKNTIKKEFPSFKPNFHREGKKPNLSPSSKKNNTDNKNLGLKESSKTKKER